MPRTRSCHEYGHDIEADHEHGGPRRGPVMEPIRGAAPRVHRDCPGLPDCRWLAGLLAHNGPFVTDHAGWHAAGSHARAYGGGDPTCTCGARTYLGVNDGAFPHLAEDASVIVCSDTGQRIGYLGEAVGPCQSDGRVERLTRVEVHLAQCDYDTIAAAADDSGVAVEDYMRRVALLCAQRAGPTLGGDP